MLQNSQITLMRLQTKTQLMKFVLHLSLRSTNLEKILQKRARMTILRAQNGTGIILFFLDNKYHQEKYLTTCNFASIIDYEVHKTPR